MEIGKSEIGAAVKKRVEPAGVKTPNQASGIRLPISIFFFELDRRKLNC
jgi:hypothetical protein